MLLEQVIKNIEDRIRAKAEFEGISNWKRTMSVTIDHEYIEVKMSGEYEAYSDKTKEAFKQFIVEMTTSGFKLDDTLEENYRSFHAVFVVGKPFKNICEYINDLANYCDKYGVEL